MLTSDAVDSLRKRVASRYSLALRDVRVVFAPYRICPLGAHIDHQRGPVTAMALDRGILLGYAPQPDAVVTLASMNFAGEVRADLASVPPALPDEWGNYPRGAIVALQQDHSLYCGLAGIVEGSAVEGGLSSSAALGVACLLALEDVNAICATPRTNIELDRYIENSYLGLKNGVLDQAAILLSRRDHLTRIDCGTLCHELWPRPATMPGFSVMIAHSGIRKALINTDYNRRVDECREAARLLLEAAGRRKDHASLGNPVLGDLTPGEYLAFGDQLPPHLARRAAHYFSESDRVDRGTIAWQAGDIAAFGKLVTESGESSIANYECGSPPLIDLFRLIAATPGVYGSRFSGAGFRGCCLALVDSSRAESIAAEVQQAYHRLHPELADAAHVWLCDTADGARIVSLDEFGSVEKP
jgi:galactokinase